MTDAFDWKGGVGESWAREHERTDRSFAGLTEMLVARVTALAPNRLLDIGCGAGETALAIGAALPRAEVLGIDLSNDLIAAAEARPVRASNVRFVVADAARWHDPGFVPDAMLSRHGVMFFDDPVQAFASLGRAAAPGARLVFSCFRHRAENEWAVAIGALIGLGEVDSDPPAPGPFAFADPAYVRRILATAGWDDIAFEPVDWDYVAGAGDDPVGDAVDFFKRIGPAARRIAALDGAERAAFLRAIGTLAEANLRDGRVTFQAGAWLVTARARGRATG